VAVLTYTSGTTGPAKGAMNTHGNIVHGARAFRDGARLDGDDVVLGIAPLFHVTGLVAHIAVALLVPMPLVLGFRFDAGEACRLAERHRATFTVAAITAYIAILDAPEAAACDLGALTKAYSGGAPVSPASAAAWEQRTGVPLHPVYGLTETTSPSHLVPLGVRPPVDPGSGALSVGRPVTGTEARIVGPGGETLGPGETGEIAIRGPQVVPGYWRNPEATAHTFPDGELRTGDVGLVDEDGWFYVVDRLKDLINASGFKVWPRDVEDVLYRHPAVREAAVVGVPDAYRGETVKAYVSLRDGADADADALIAFARERLASYKYPREVEIVAELPKTASGKILRRELRAR
jgi:long-chain acyl-CoA synthetase